MGDWLGTGAIASQSRSYQPFEEARRYARSLKLSTINEWQAFCRGKMKFKGILPSDIPSKPDRVYRNKGWASVGDWLGTGSVANFHREYRSFNDARSFVRSIGLKSNIEWLAYCKGAMPTKGKLPKDIPSKPSRTYANKGWRGIGDWLGTGAIAPKFREYKDFELARSYVRKLKLSNQREWFLFCRGLIPEKGKLPCDIPGTPHIVYAKKGWRGYGDWLGTGNVVGGKQGPRNSKAV